MYKDYFENKKVVIFDLETIIYNTHEIYSEVVFEVLKDIDLEWVYLPEIIKEGMTLEEIWNNLTKKQFLENKVPYKVLYETFLSRLNNRIRDEDNFIETKEGFFGIIYELKEDYGFTLILKSELNKYTTQTIVDKLELSDYFDLIIFQEDPLNTKNLYKQILNQLKKYKLNSKDCLALEGHPRSSHKSANQNILTIGITSKDKSYEDFSYKVTLKLTDFTDLLINLDKNYKQSLIYSNPDIEEKLNTKKS